MRSAIFIFCLFVSFFATAQIKTQAIAKSALPKSISYLGRLVHAIQFEDQTGTYLALTTQTGQQPQKGDEDLKQAHLYAYVYQLKGNTAPKLLWQLHDMVTDCNLDMITEFVPNSLAFTDLDKNGKAEVWVAYRLSCRGDVSPSDLKIIMHEGSTKYAMRGTSKIKVGHFTDGGAVNSNDFKRGPAIFNQYAGKLWNKYVLEVLN